MSRLLSRIPDLIIVNSQTGLEHYSKKGYPSQNMVVISNGIDTERFQPNPEGRHRVRAEWGVKEGYTLIGLVGRLVPKKDHPTFLKAAAQLAKARADVYFFCVGDGPQAYKKRLLNLSHQLGLSQRLVWVGSRADMPDVYNALDIAVSASSYGEGFSNSVGEAMACGVPCVVTDVGDSAAIVGDTGVVVPPRDPESFVRAWQEMLENIEAGGSRLGQLARQRIMEHFGVQQLVDTTEQELQRAIREKYV